MLPPLQDLYRIAPEIVLCAFGMLVMFLAAGTARASPCLWRVRHRPCHGDLGSQHAGAVLGCSGFDAVWASFQTFSAAAGKRAIAEIPSIT